MVRSHKLSLPLFAFADQPFGLPGAAMFPTAFAHHLSHLMYEDHDVKPAVARNSAYPARFPF
jgi:hypothetical protein